MSPGIAVMQIGNERSDVDAHEVLNSAAKFDARIQIGKDQIGPLLGCKGVEAGDIRIGSMCSILYPVSQVVSWNEDT